MFIDFVLVTEGALEPDIAAAPYLRPRQARGIGVLITDHNVRETLDICEKAYIVGEGRIVAEGNAEAVLNNQIVRDIYLGDTFTL